MTIARFAVAGAAILNLPTLYAASVLPASAVAISAALLAVIGAALGAVVGWAISSRIDAAVAAVRVEPAGIDRIAA